MGSRAGKISYLCGSAVKLLCWGPPGKRESDDKHTHCPGPNPAPGAALKCFLLAYCFRKDGIHFNKFAFNKNPSWRICRPRRAEAWKNGQSAFQMSGEKSNGFRFTLEIRSESFSALMDKFRQKAKNCINLVDPASSHMPVSYTHLTLPTKA